MEMDGYVERGMAEKRNTEEDAIFFRPQISNAGQADGGENEVLQTQMQFCYIISII